MEPLLRLLKSTIGGKTLVGITGLGLSGFVFAHMAGNMLIFVGPEAYNMYGHKLINNPLIYVAEAGLVFMFIAHLGKALQLSLRNHQARPQKYAVAAAGEKRTTAVQKTMWAQGLIILVFVILHLCTFKYSDLPYEATYNGETVRDLHRLVVEVFQSPVYVGGYIFALLVLGAHLSHGFGSAFQSLGLNHPKYTPTINCLSWIYAIVVAGGFISQPIYVFFIH